MIADIYKRKVKGSFIGPKINNPYRFDVYKCVL